MSKPSEAPTDYTFASDNTAGIAPEAWAALAEANSENVPSYGDDRWTAEARRLVADVFETDCEVFFVFNGTAANALALAHAVRGYQSVVCHDFSHVETDECGAPEFFSGGAKVIPVVGPGGKLRPPEVEAALRRGHGVHFPKPGAISLTQATEWGTVYTPDGVGALCDVARSRNLVVQMDGARFANAAVTLAKRGMRPADYTWRAGVDVLSFGGTKNGLAGTEAVVFFNRELARDFDYRLKQGGQLNSKMRFATAQWVGLLRDGAWLRHAAHANENAQRLADGLRGLNGFRLIAEPEANGVFVEMSRETAGALEKRGWHFYLFIGENGYRFMCSWAVRSGDVDRLLADARDVAKRT